MDKNYIVDKAAEKNSESLLGSSFSSANFCGNDEQEYLRTTWDKLGVGQDGLLSLEDLGKVCEAIGLEKDSIKVITNLFEGLDVDGDGRITFDEFMHIFQSTGSANHSQVFDTSQNQENVERPESRLSFIGSSGIYSDLANFSSLNADGCGYVHVTRLLEIWYSLGLSDGSNTLRELGLPSRQGEKLYIRDLVTALEEECRQFAETKQAALLLLLYEIRSLRCSLEGCQHERDKYRWDLNEANHRISLLASEIDDQSEQVEAKSKRQMSNLERQHRDKLRELEDALKRERDQSTDVDIKVIQQQYEELQLDENRLKQQIASQDNDIRKLMLENSEICEKMRESENHIIVMEKQISELKFVERKIAEIEVTTPREEDYNDLMQKLDQLNVQNQTLRDENDELMARIDMLSMKPGLNDKDYASLDGSIIGNYLDPMHSGGMKRRGDSHYSDVDEADRSKIMKKDYSEKHLNFHYFDVAAYDESFDASIHDRSRKLIPSPVLSVPSPKSRQYFNSRSLPPSATKEDMEQNSSSQDQKEILSLDSSQRRLLCSTPSKSKCLVCLNLLRNLRSVMLSVLDNVKCYKDGNDWIETHVKSGEAALDDLSAEEIMDILKKMLLNSLSEWHSLKECNKTDSSAHHDIEQRCINLSRKLQKKVALFEGGISTIQEEEEDESNCDINNSFLRTFSLLEKEVVAYEEKSGKERDYIEKQKAGAEDRCERLEKEMEILRCDLASADDYWRLKIKEETEYYDEERKLYDEKFSELEKKIREYEALKNDPSSITQNSDESDRLSTIDENVYWEKQVTELEEEVKILVQRNDTLMAQSEDMEKEFERQIKCEENRHNNEITKLKLQLEILKSNSHHEGEIELPKVRNYDKHKAGVKNGTWNKLPTDMQLTHANKRISKLEGTLRLLQKNTVEIMSKTQERHEDQIKTYQTMLASTEQAHTTCLAKQKDHVSKISRGDVLVKKLYIENAQLMLALQVAEERQKQAESTVRDMCYSF